MSDFDFMPITIELVGNKIRDTLRNKPPQEDWSQQPPQPQGIKMAPPSPNLDSFCMDKSSTIPLPPGNEEQVQDEQEEEPQQILIDEVSEEGKICEKP